MTARDGSTSTDQARRACCIRFEQEDNMKILGIDFDSVFRRNWEAEDGKEMGAAHRRTVEWIAKLRDGWDRVVIAADSGPSFRKAKVETYKAGRTNPGAAYFEQRKRTLVRLKADACVIVEGPELDGGHAEADDVLGWLVDRFVAHCRAHVGETDLDNWYLRIVSQDGDLEQLVSDADGVDLLKLTGGDAWKEVQVYNARGVPPHKVAHLKALCGDKSDAYEGFQGIGDKTGATLINRFGDAVAAVAGADDPAVKLTAPQRASLKAGGPDLAAKGLYLATLRTDLPLDFASIIFPEPQIGTIVGDEPLGGEPVPAPRPTPAAPEPAASRALAPSAAPEPEKPSAALAVRPQNGHAMTFGPLDLQPSDLESAWRVTKPLFEARVYPQFPNRESMLAAIMDARERGVPVSAALRNAYVVKGKLGWSAGYLAGLVLSSGRADYFELVPDECDDKRATVRFRRVGRHEGRHAFTIEDARKAGYFQSGMWEKEPRAMLRAAAVRTAARAYFPDVVANLYMPDELRGTATDDDMTAANV